MKVTDTLTTVAKGSVGAGGIEVITQAVELNQVTEGMGILTQVIILIATLIGIFKKKKNKTVEK